MGSSKRLGGIMETLIVGLVINIYTWSNADFFVQRKNNERQYTCVWVDKKYKQECVIKEKE